MGWVFCVAVVCADTRALQTGMPLVACGTPCGAGFSGVCALVVRCQPHAKPVCSCRLPAHLLNTSTLAPLRPLVPAESLLDSVLHPHTSPACVLPAHACSPHNNFLLCLFSLELQHCTLSRQPTSCTFGCRLFAGMFWECSAAQWVGTLDWVPYVDVVLCLDTVGCGRFLLAGHAAVSARALRAWQTQAVQQLEWIICIC